MKQHRNASQIIDTEQTEDLTGRSRLASNVIFSWGGYIVFFIAGFILPRLIDSHIGQVSLGVWDFSWSLINYLSLSGLGIGSSVNRYVAKYRAAKDIKSLNATISSVFYIQLAISFLVLLATFLLVWLLPVIFGDRLGEEITTSRWVVALLGFSLSVQMLFDPFRGIITGCHRWDIHNTINATSKTLSFLGMTIVLFMGKGLIGLGAVHLASVIITEIFRFKTAEKICKELKVTLKYSQIKQAKKMFQFGIKTIVAGLPLLILVQTSNIIIASSLGPAALAVFSRPIALVRHIENFINRFVFILTPTAGSLLGKGLNDELRLFVITSTRYSIAFTLPLVLFLIVFGDQVLNLWMGEGYANWPLMAILAGGYFLPISQSSVLRVLMGMNQHGRIALISLATSIIGFLFCFKFIFSPHPNLITAGLMVALPLALANGVLLPIYGCRILNIPLLKYVHDVFLIPSVCCLLYAIFIISVRIIFSNNILSSLGIGLFGGYSILTILYWFFLIPIEEKDRVVLFFKTWITNASE